MEKIYKFKTTRNLRYLLGKIIDLYVALSHVYFGWTEEGLDIKMLREIARPIHAQINIMWDDIKCWRDVMEDHDFKKIDNLIYEMRLEVRKLSKHKHDVMYETKDKFDKVINWMEFVKYKVEKDLEIQEELENESWR